MDRKEFIEKLKVLLGDIPESERQEALDYYESYFDDAGPENEKEVLQKLGSPEKVAATIKADLKESNDDYGEYTENGYTDIRIEPKRTVPAERMPKKGQRAALILLLILLIFISPFLKGTLGGIVGLAIGILLLPCWLGLASGAMVIAFAVSGIALFAAGIAVCTASGAAGLMVIGISCLLIAACLVLLVLTVFLIGKVLPAYIRKILDWCSDLFHRGRDGA